MTSDSQSGRICINKLITHREDFFLTRGFGISGVQGTALSPIHCSRGESAPFGFTSCGNRSTTHEVKHTHLTGKTTCGDTVICLMLNKRLTFGAIRLTMSDISTTLLFLSPDPENK